MMTNHFTLLEQKRNVDLGHFYSTITSFPHLLFLLETNRYNVQVNELKFLSHSEECSGQHFNLILLFKLLLIKNGTYILNVTEWLLLIYQVRFIIQCELLFNKKMSTLKPVQKSTRGIIASKRTDSKSINSHSNVVVPQLPVWQRRDSFSSCSSDSAVYCSSRHRPEANCEKVDRSLPGRQPDHLMKRHRHSSGSSASSNVSCLSEREPKQSFERNLSHLSDSTGAQREEVPMPSSQKARNSPLLSSSAKVQTVIEERISYSCESEASPLRHNLRRNIRKKTCCNCDCSASRTTVVVRRFTQIRQETEHHHQRDVITQSTVEVTSPSESMNNSFMCSEERSESKSANKKRRREVDKLYDALHEIKWASHFSPDNILRQIDIRRAASCSVFSPSKKAGVNRSVPKHKISFVKKTSVNNEVNSNAQNLTKSVSKVNNKRSLDSPLPPLNNSHGRVTRLRNQAANGTLLEEAIMLPAQVKTRKRQSNLTSASLNSDKNGSFSSVNLSKEKESFDQNQTTILINNNLIEDSVSSSSSICNSSSEFSLPETKQSSLNQEGKHCSEMICDNINSSSSPLERNDIVYNKDDIKNTISEIVSFVDESPNISTDTESIEKESLKSLCVSNFNSSLDASDGSSLMKSNFLDISEAVETIDVCFRKVVDEVEFSNLGSSHDLPSLTSVNEISPIKKPRYDEPPLLELCTVPSVECNISSGKEKERSKTLNQSCMPFRQIFSPKKQETKLKNIEAPSSTYPNGKKGHIASCARKKSLNQVAHKFILRKYLNYLKSEPHKKLSSAPVEESSSAIESCSMSNSSKSSDHVYSICPEDSEVESLTSSIDNTRSFSSKSISPDSVEFNVHSSSSELSVIKKSDCEDVLTKPYHYHREVSNHAFYRTHNNSIAYHSNSIAQSMQLKAFNSINDFKSMPIIDMKSSIAENYISSLPKELPRIKAKEPERKDNENVLRHSMHFGFTFHYKAITVNRNESYTQILLKITRGRSIFLTHEALIELKEAVTGAKNDVRCHVLIINGTGDCFCSGLDLKPLIGPRKAKASAEIAVAIKDLIQALADFQKPLVAVVNGAASGLGLTLLNHADVSIASDEATFCMPYVHLGYSPEGGATLTLPQAVGSTAAMDLLLRGRVLTAREACELGLISEVLEAKRMPYELVSRVKVLVENPKTALETTKALLRMRLLQELPSVLENEVKLLPRMWLSSSCQEALHKAFETGLIED